jgi:hypothetical protein
MCGPLIPFLLCFLSVDCYQRVTIRGDQQILHQRITKQEDQKTDTRELTELSSEANQQTGARELPTYLRSEANQQTGTRESSDLRYVGNSLVSVCWLASDLRSVVNSLVD